MSSPTTPWQQILGIAQNTPTNAANTINGLPSGASATPGLTTGLPIAQYTNPNAVTPQQVQQNIAGATSGAQSIQDQVRKAEMAQGNNSAESAAQAQQAANQAAASIPTPDQSPNTTNNPSVTIPGLTGQPSLRCGGMVEKKALGGPMNNPIQGAAPGSYTGSPAPARPFGTLGNTGTAPNPPTGGITGAAPGSYGAPPASTPPQGTVNRPIGGGGFGGVRPQPVVNPAGSTMPGAPKNMAVLNTALSAAQNAAPPGGYGNPSLGPTGGAMRQNPNAAALAGQGPVPMNPQTGMPYGMAPRPSTGMTAQQPPQANTSPMQRPAQAPPPAAPTGGIPGAMPGSYGAAPVGRIQGAMPGSYTGQACGGMVEGRAGGGMVGMKGMHPIAKIHVQTVHPLRMTNPMGSSGSFAEGGSMEEGRTDHIDPGTAEFETHAMGGQVEHMADAARHLRGIHHMLPKSAQIHNEKAHKAALDEMHNSAFSKQPAEPTDPNPAAGPGMGTESSDSSPSAAPQTPTAGEPEFKKGGEVKPKEHKADMKEEAKKKKDHEKKSAGGAIRGKAGEEEDAKASPARYARGGYVDPGTTEFSCGSPDGKGKEQTARGMGAAKRGGEFSYKHGGKVKK